MRFTRVQLHRLTAATADLRDDEQQRLPAVALGGGADRGWRPPEADFQSSLIARDTGEAGDMGFLDP